jgi:flagellin
MPVAISGGARIRTNTAAENAYNALMTSSDSIAKSQLRISTGKRINAASDDVAGYITARSLASRNGSLKSALQSVGDAKNVTAITQDALDNVNSLLTNIKDSAATASSAALGTDEKVALAKGAYRMAQQIQTVVDSTVFGGKQLLDGSFSGDWSIGFMANNTILTIGVDLTTSNEDFNTSFYDASGNFQSTNTFDIKSINDIGAKNFAGVSGLNLKDLNSVASDDLGIFSTDKVKTTIQSLTFALNNINKVASYIGGIDNRLSSQESLLNSQVTNYNAAISRIEDADVATEQLSLVKAQFLQTSSLTSLTQANNNPSSFMQLFR